MTDDLFARKSDMYRSASFRAEFADIVGIDNGRADICLDGLLVANAIPYSGDDCPGKAIYRDAAFLLASLSARDPDVASIVPASKRFLLMEFQVEYGAEANGDRKGCMEAASHPEKELFGTQLVEAIGAAWHDRVVDCYPPLDLTIGWDAVGPDSYGLLRYHPPKRNTTFVYSTADIFPNLDPRIVSFQNVTFNFITETYISSAAIGRIGDLMHDY
jgi:hypothetical protein